MVDTYGRWTYEPDTPEEKKCDCDRIADWIISTGYQVETSIENLVELIISYAEDWYTSERDYWEYNFEDVKEYVENSGGIAEFDFEFFKI